ncbi:MAG: glutathione peroxidase [Oxalobacteraceae bacterium]|nr:glutathione peroxidase [Oxalobacteraceae bacterium]
MIRLHTSFSRQCLMTLSLVLGLMMASAVVPAAANECPALLNHKFNRLQDDSPQNLCQYSGKVVLVVNTASYCGFTSQYEGLEKLYASYKDKGLVVLGFPSNDFSQEPGNNKEIADFCYNTYGVKFPMFAKTSVKGKEANALFAALIKAGAKAPSWNFNKYLIDREGKLVANYGSTTRPDEKTFVSALEKALAAQ